MAKRNRKHGHHGNRGLCWGLALLLIGAAVAMVYLSLYNSCERIGRNIKKMENQCAELHKRVVNEERNWAMARSIGNMERLMESHGIVMSWPEEKNIIRLQAAELDEPAQYAYQGGTVRRD